MSDYYVILTDAGQALMSAATAGGAPVVLSQFGVDDGNGAVITPDPAQTTLVNEVYRGDISSLMATGNTIKAQLVIPKDSGGYTVQGFGLYTDDGTLFSVCNFPAQEKPLPSSGYAVKMDTDYYLQVSDTSVVTLQFNGDDYLTREQADTIYLQIGNNLSEIAAGGAAAQAEALDNLGAGTAAVADVQTSTTDTTVGRAMTVGAFGLGLVANRTPVVTSNNYDNIPTDLPSGYWTHVVDGGPYAYTFTLFQDGGAVRQSRHLIIPSNPGGKIAFRWDGATETESKDYQYFYTDKNKPTAADTGALPITGGTVTGPVIIDRDSNALTIRPVTQGYSSYLMLADADNANRAYVGFGSNNNETLAISSYIGTNSIGINPDGSIDLNTAHGKQVNVVGPIYVPLVGNGSWASQNDSIAPLFQTIDSTQTSQYNPIFKQHYVQADSTWSGGMLISEGDFHLHYADGSGASVVFSFKKDGTFAPSNYANFDARYLRVGDAVQDCAFGARGSFSVGGGSFDYEKSGCVLVGFGGDGNGDDIDYLYYRPDQITFDNVNWVTKSLLGAPSPLLYAGVENLIFEPYGLADIGNVLSRFTLSDSAVMGIHALVNNDGYDWYRARSNLVGNYFIAYHDDTGVIEQITDFVQALWPVNMAVAALDALPDGCDIHGSWIFADGIVQQSSEIVAANTLATNKKSLAIELTLASSTAFMLQSCIDVETGQPDDENSLLELKQYVSDLREIDLTQPDPTWPPRPEIIS
ncbi:phage tail protein [Buttiauxella gaviniae]|uniref:phage tail-collar fiber domain-containing protein n=1 Tax=Buttiauxella gaviniae TaxID=82990 RepID=UPI0039764E64